MDNPVERAKGYQGWMYPEELEWLYEAAKRMNSIVEIGSWQGRSTYVLLSGCRGPVVAVDKWDVELMKSSRDAQVARRAFFENTERFHQSHGDGDGLSPGGHGLPGQLGGDGFR